MKTGCLGKHPCHLGSDQEESLPPSLCFLTCKMGTILEMTS